MPYALHELSTALAQQFRGTQQLLGHTECPRGNPMHLHRRLAAIAALTTLPGTAVNSPCPSVVRDTERVSRGSTGSFHTPRSPACPSQHRSTSQGNRSPYSARGSSLWEAHAAGTWRDGVYTQILTTFILTHLGHTLVSSCTSPPHFVRIEPDLLGAFMPPSPTEVPTLSIGREPHLLATIQARS